MTDDGRMNGWVALLVLAGLGLVVAGVAMAPAALPTWLMGGGAVALAWALNIYRHYARRSLDPRRSDQPTVTYERRDFRP